MRWRSASMRRAASSPGARDSGREARVTPASDGMRFLGTKEHTVLDSRDGGELMCQVGERAALTGNVDEDPASLPYAAGSAPHRAAPAHRTSGRWLLRGARRVPRRVLPRASGKLPATAAIPHRAQCDGLRAGRFRWSRRSRGGEPGIAARPRAQAPAAAVPSPKRSGRQRELRLRGEKRAQVNRSGDERCGAAAAQRARCIHRPDKGPLRAERTSALEREQNARLETIHVLRRYCGEHRMRPAVGKTEPRRAIPYAPTACPRSWGRAPAPRSSRR